MSKEHSSTRGGASDTIFNVEVPLEPAKMVFQSRLWQIYFCFETAKQSAKNVIRTSDFWRGQVNEALPGCD